MMVNRSDISREVLELTAAGMRSTVETIKSKVGDVVEITEIEADLSGLKECESIETNDSTFLLTLDPSS